MLNSRPFWVQARAHAAGDADAFQSGATAEVKSAGTSAPRECGARSEGVTGCGAGEPAETIVAGERGMQATITFFGGAEVWVEAARGVGGGVVALEGFFGGDPVVRFQLGEQGDFGVVKSGGALFVVLCEGFEV